MVDLKSPSPSEEDIQNILVLLNSKEYGAAEVSVNKLIDQFPGKEILYNILGAILHSQKKSYEAIDAYNKATDARGLAPRVTLGIFEVF